jgi:hypothetical protein
MNGRITRGCGLAAMVATLVALAACSDDPFGPQDVCNCPLDVGLVTIDLCGAIDSFSADPDGTCDVQQSTASLQLISDVPGTCHVEVTFATGATASTDVTFTSSWLPCGSDPHGCGQAVSGTPALSSLGPCAEAGTQMDAGGQ